jgi:sulfate permease, SulP family
MNIPVTFRPKLLEALRSYDRDTFLSDLGAGVTVGIVALPLAIGFAIASGVEPSRGLWTAIIAGLLISALGGSLVQVGGPTGAFVPILFGIVVKFGYGGLVVATIMAGIILVAMGALKLGSLIKFIPYPVTAGFTSGIAVIIFVGQLKEFLGLGVKLPGHTTEQAVILAQNLARTNLAALGLGVFALVILIAWPKSWQRLPASIVAVIVTTLVVVAFHLDVPTIGSRFGGIPRGLPSINLPKLSFLQVQDLMIPALTIAMLGSIESLLSAIVADGMIESRHDSNQELIGQGIANIVCPLFGGISATGAIARTATNIRSGAKTPIAGIIHSLTLLMIVLLGAPLAKFIPLTALSAVLLVVAYRMGEWENFLELWRGPKSDFTVLVVTFTMTVVFDLTVADLTVAVGVGLTMAGVLFVRRMEEITQIKLVTSENEMDVGGGSVRDKEIPPGVLVYRIEGPFFFGAAEKLEAALGRYSAVPRVVIFRMRTVPLVDATGLHALEVMLDKFHRRGTHLILSGVQPQPMKVLYNAGFIDKIGLDNVCANIDVALEQSRRLTEQPATIVYTAWNHRP